MYKRNLFLKLGALLVAFALLSAGAARADQLYGGIRGVITDATGASVPDVTVTATNTDTGISKTVNSASDGSYELLNLPLGNYKVVAVKVNFKTFTTSGVKVAVNQTYLANIQLELGSISQQVNVEAASTQVETTSMQLGGTLESKFITDMPLNGRNWIQLQQLQPGVVGASDRFGTGSGGTNFSTNGGQTQQNSFLINGTDSNDLPINAALVIPSPDAIGEFQLITNTINPEYGRNSGAILNAVIKSGTNHFHGDGFNFYRDTSMNARTFFQPTPTVFHQNQFGGTLGGPVWKDHTFGFFSYQGTRARQPSNNGTGTTTVFNAAQRAGTFVNAAGAPQVASNKPAPIPLFGDSASPCPVSGGVRCPAGTTYKTLFNSGVIPTQDFNTLSSNLVNQFIPLPTNGNNFSFNPARTVSADQYIYRLDHTFSQHDSLWFYSFLQTNPVTDSLPFTGSTLPGFAQVSQSHIKQYTAAWTHTFNGSTLNELRFGYTRLNFVAVQPQNIVQPSSLGFQINPQSPAVASVPRITVNGFFNIGFSSNGPQPRKDQTYQVTDNFSKIVGKHTLKMGFEGRRFEVGNPFFGSHNGRFIFSTANPFSSGNAGADFLLGFPSTYAQTSGGFIDARAYQMYSYIQDQFKLRPNLTLTYGMGLQIDTPLSDLANGGVAINCFLPSQQSTVFSSAPKGLNFPGDPGCNSAGYESHYNQFGPRIGFAYSPDWGKWTGGPGKTSIRGGFGIYFNRSEEELSLQNLSAPPFSLADAGIADVGGHPSFSAPFTDVACINSALGPIPGCVSSNTFLPNGVAAPTSIVNKYPFVPPAPGSNPDFANFEPMGLNVIDPNFRSPYAENFNLTIERELPGRTILSVAYVGSVAHHLIAETEVNHVINPANCLADPACAADSNNAVTLASQQSNFPYPGTTFASVGQQSSFGNSNYNSLQVTANKQMSHGLTFLAAYTYSHSLDIGSSFEGSGFGGLSGPGLSPFNTHLNYGDSAFDARHRLVASYTYDIPSLQRIAPWLPSRVASGWRFGGITTFQGGFPIYPVEGDSNSLTCSGNWQFYNCADRPNQIAPIKLLNPRNSPNHLVFDPNSFAPEALGQLGNLSRSAVHALGINNWDFQFSKDTRITEGKTLELRVELFNMWNHTQFDSVAGGSIDNNVLNLGTFGETFATKPARIMQLAAKFIF
jgi:hypothetical protein